MYCIVEYDRWFDIKGWNLKINRVIKWTDKMGIDNKMFKRIIKPYFLYIDAFNGKIDFLERLYDFPDIVLHYKSKEFDEKYGSLNLETMI